MKRKTLAHIGFALYIVLLVWLVIFKLEPRFWALPQTGRSLNLIPFGASMIRNGGISLSEIVYNALFFVPLGMYLSFLNVAKKPWQGILVGFAVSIAFEVVQYVFMIGASDITDIIMNTIGTAIGVFIGVKLRAKADAICIILLAAEIILLIGYIVLLAAQ